MKQIFDEYKNWHVVAIISIINVILLLIYSSAWTNNSNNLDSFLNFRNEIRSEEINNYGPNIDMVINPNANRDVNQSDLKTILMWNEAYGAKQMGFEHGREAFFKFKCPETRCVTTDDRSYLDDVSKFDAIMIHQRSVNLQDLPKKRSPHQRYVYWVMESAQYPFMDIRKLNGMFNWTMTFKRNSDFLHPYGYVVKTSYHPEKGPDLDRYIKIFGQKNVHLALGKKKWERPRAAWFVSNCHSRALREQYVNNLKKFMDVDIYGSCGSFTCPRKNSTKCYLNMEKDYKFYLSFENSMCDGYVTEKYFNILSYNVIPIVYGGSDYENDIGPHHGFINAKDFGLKKPEKLVERLREINEDDAKFAEYFWWRDFYEIRSKKHDRAQSYCQLCQRLHNPDEPAKVYDDMYDWWVTDSHCEVPSFN